MSMTLIIGKEEKIMKTVKIKQKEMFYLEGSQHECIKPSVFA